MNNNVSLREAQDIMLQVLKEVDRICRENNIKYFLDCGTLLGAVRHQGFIPWDDDVDISMLREDYEKFKSIAQSKLGEEYFLQTPETDKAYRYFHIPMKVRHNNSKLVESIESENEEFNQGMYIDIFPMDFVETSKFKNILGNIYKFIMERCTLPYVDKSEFTLQRKIIYPVVYSFLKCTSLKKRRRFEKWFIYKGKKDKQNIVPGIELPYKYTYKYEDIYPLKEIEFEGSKFFAPNNTHAILEGLYGDYMKLPEEKDRFYHSKSLMIFENENGIEIVD